MKQKLKKYRKIIATRQMSLLIDHEICPKIKSRLSFVVPHIGGQCRTVQCYSVSNTRMQIPRFALKGKEISDSVLPCPVDFVQSLRENQISAVKVIYADLALYCTSLAYLYTGFGKTACAIYLAACFKPQLLVIYVHKLSLQIQWKEAICKFLRNTSVSIRTIQKQLRNLDEMCNFDENTFVIFDETHHIAADCFSQLLKYSTAGYHLAVSATKERKDGLEKLLELFFGRPSVVLTDLQFKPSVFVSKFNGTNLYDFRYRRVYKEDIVDYNDVLERLCCSEERNLHIMSILQKLGNRNILVLSRRRKHVVNMHHMASSFSEDCRILLGGMKESELAKAKAPEGETKFILFATTSAAGEGFDLDTLQCILLATPSTNVQQEVGRILRKRQSDALVVDVVDQCGLLISQFQRRKKFYTEQGLNYISL